MKKVISWALALTMSLGLALPAAAANETSDEALKRITQMVKETLDLDTGAYSGFQGEREEVASIGMWNLSWSRMDEGLSIEALDDGTITSYSLDLPYSPSSSGDFPTFPRGDEASAAQSAQVFLDKVLSDGESVELGQPRGMDTLSGNSYRFSGEVLLNGLSSPLTYSITVRASDNQVTRFNRDAAAGIFLGDVPGNKPAIGQPQASEALKESLALRLEYVLEEDGTTAVLRYLPEDTDTFYIDAATGEALNITELEALVDGGVGAGGSSNASGDSSASREEGLKDLSQAEQAGIAKLEGVLSTGALDQRVRSVAAYGLSGYALASASYELEEAEEGARDQVLCVLSYVRSSEDDSTSRMITVDARTGAVESIWSSASRLEDAEHPPLTLAEAQKKAEDFLKGFCGDRWAALTLYESRNDTENRRPYYTFTYVQAVNEIPFPENCYTIAVDCRDGSVYRLNYRYSESVTFANPTGIVDEVSALDAWMGTYDTALGYRLVPRALNSSNELEAYLIGVGFSHYYGLKLTYALEREDYCLGIDAATGKPVWREVGDSTISYTDLDGSWAKADVEKLASYDVGYDGGTFRPQKNLTQWDMVALLVSLEGYRIDPTDADRATADSVYSTAYRMGALAREERDEERAVTRGELVKYLLNCAGYGPAARLEGIFTCSYSDAADIPSSELGYAALAQGLGMVQGGYHGDRVATRAEMSAMLCRLLER